MPVSSETGVQVNLHFLQWALPEKRRRAAVLYGQLLS
jgi:hypothetical protein